MDKPVHFTATATAIGVGCVVLSFRHETISDPLLCGTFSCAFAPSVKTSVIFHARKAVVTLSVWCPSWNGSLSLTKHVTKKRHNLRW